MIAGRTQRISEMNEEDVGREADDEGLMLIPIGPSGSLPRGWRLPIRQGEETESRRQVTFSGRVLNQAISL